MARVFVSHAHDDEAVVGELVSILCGNLNLRPSDFLATSRPGRGLELGKRVFDELRGHLGAAEVVVAIVTTRYLRSAWCLFELGAAAYSDKKLMTVLVPPVSRNHITGPARDLIVLSNLFDADSLRKLRDALETTLSPDGGSGTAGWEAAMSKFLRQFGPPPMDEAKLQPLRCEMSEVPPPKNPVTALTDDESDLYFALIKTPAVAIAWDRLIAAKDAPSTPRLIELMDVIGEYDLVAKIRTGGTPYPHDKASEISKWLRGVLNAGGAIVGEHDGVVVVDVTTSSDVAIESPVHERWIRALLSIRFRDETGYETARETLQSAIELGARPHRATRGVYFSNVGGTRRAIVEYVFGCGGYRDLINTVAEIEDEIERALVPYLPSKTTLTVMRSWASTD